MSRSDPDGVDERLIVASVPSSHVYVRHIAAENDDGVTRLPDPDPEAPSRSAQQRWWPPVMLSREWVERHDFDVFHLQFGFDAWDPEELGDVVQAVHEKGCRFVYTVHDLRNPHHLDRSLHDAQLDVLLVAADDVLTLTDGAAREISHRWGRVARVLPHPHVVDLDSMARRSRRGRTRRPAEFRVGLHVKSLRASMAPLDVLPTLAATAAEIPGGVLQVNGHKDVLLPDGARYDPELSDLLRTLERLGAEVHVHDFFADEELFDYLEGLSVSVLPYRFGTHSGWLEACRDLGTAVLAPSCGYYRDQGPVHEFVLDEQRWEPDSMRRALRDAYDAGPPAPVPVRERRDQRASLAAAHRSVYGATSAVVREAG